MRFDFPGASELNRLQNEMDRLFGDRLGTPMTPPRAYPPINLWEDDDHLFVESEIPGMQLAATGRHASGANVRLVVSHASFRFRQASMLNKPTPTTKQAC